MKKSRSNRLKKALVTAWLERSERGFSANLPGLLAAAKIIGLPEINSSEEAELLLKELEKKEQRFAENEKVFHVSGRRLNIRRRTDDFHLQRGTVFFRQVNGLWYATVVRCDSRDTFSRSRGRTLARRKWFLYADKRVLIGLEEPELAHAEALYLGRKIPNRIELADRRSNRAVTV